MIDGSTLLLFSLAALALTASPGPDMLLIAARSAAQGRIAGFATYAGIALGTYCHAAAAALGLSQLFLAVPIAYDAVRYAGAVYLLYLAWSTIRVKPDPLVEAITPKSIEIPARVMFRQGLTTNLLNPKMVIFILALFPQFVDPLAGSVAIQIMIFATIINVFGFFVNGVVILTSHKASEFLSTRGAFRDLSQYVLGTVFAGLALRLAFDADR